MNKAPPKVMMAAYRNDFPSFARKSFSVLNPGTVYRHNWHLDAICYQLQRVLSWQCSRLIINVPPRCLKTHVGSISLPAYMLGLDPTKKIVCVSYSQNLSEKYGFDCRRLIEHPWYRTVFQVFALIEAQQMRSQQIAEAIALPRPRTGP